MRRGWGIVTPRAGVWIETTCLLVNLQTSGVTPRAGVWIETRVIVLTSLTRVRHPPRTDFLDRRDLFADISHARASPPVRGCGLKQNLGVVGMVGDRVTPRAGVWIETFDPDRWFDG